MNKLLENPDFALAMERGKVTWNAYQEFTATVSILHSDVVTCSERLNKEGGSQYWRRALVRAFFAKVEGVIHCMKRIAYSCRFQPGVEFSEGELMFLTEKTYQLNDKGEVYDQRMQTSLKSNIKFAFRAYARAHLVDYKLNVGDDTWNDFKNSLLVRDRLTHPKEVRNLEVSDEELKSLQRAFDWFSECQDKVSALSERALESKLRAELPPELMAQLDQLLERVNYSI
ncbi:MAG TPA: hypothetical protein VJZ77_01175 [Blastocatellia bacterium]|nr:hypothetical protein [Blastocatellia bacterium]